MTGAPTSRTTVAAAILMERLIRDAYPARHSSEIQPLQWSILRYLARVPEDQRQLSRIAPFLNLTAAPVARALTTLAQRGMLTQRVSETDSRIKTITLTELGVDALRQDPIISVASRIDTLPENERRDFIKSIRSIALGVTHPPKPVDDDSADTDTFS
ncbi:MULTISPECIES: MarR family winged helix-turn-helix transcriptional regulator [Roseobacteraceae]|uniref:Winged helix DNA-binding domain protein n=1 Tax=Pseudosulfitobacter pseudonitzschiae TaxID=1402135 RepID=A0A221K2W5_9RHOB|nr:MULTISPECIES: winged helix DNA-binding protein [Roseobacteraceae]ASM73341.1 winged helix DNA-binding domain protein [Pseudosulfitobacter pseudonitzschiae]